MLSSTFMSIAALLTSSVGTLCLWLWWQKNNKHYLIGACPFIIASQLCWQVAYQIEFGSIYFLLFISLLALLVVAKNASTQPVKTTNWLKKPPHAKLFETKTLIFSILIHGVVLAIVSVLITLMIAQMLPLSQANQMAFAALCFSIIWALLSIWLLITQQKKRTYLCLTIASFIAVIVILITGLFTYG